MNLADQLAFDLRYARRRLLQHRTFSLAIALSLALGIGANTAMVSLLDALMFRAPAHVREANQVMQLSVATFLDFEALAQRARRFASVGAAGSQPLSLETENGTLSTVRAAYVSDSYFTTFGTTPLVGRFPAADENRRGAEPVAVLAASTWRRWFGSDRGIVGRNIRLGGRAFTVIGVAPEGFVGFGRRPADVFLPLLSATLFMGEAPFADRRISWLQTFGRLRAGASSRQAALEVTAFIREGQNAEPRWGNELPATPIVPLLQALRDSRQSVAQVAVWVTAVAGIILLVAAVNVANLVGLQSKRDEFANAVHAALGASPARVVRLRVVELGVLALMGAGAGVLLAALIRRIYVLLLVPSGVLVDIPLDGRFAITCVMSTVLALGIGLRPSLVLRRRIEVSSTLRRVADIPRRGSIGRRQVVVGLQLALLAVLLVGAGAFQKSVRAVQAADLGIQAGGLYVVPIDFESISTPPSQIRGRLDRLHERLRTIPSVVGTADVVGRTFLGEISLTQSVPGRDSLPSARTLGVVPADIVSQDFFRVVGTPVIAGRGFDDSDIGAARRVMIVSQRFAEAYWPGESAIGRCVHLFGSAACTDVIGVAKDRRGVPPDSGRIAEYFVPSGAAGIPTEPTAAFSPRVILVKVSAPRSGIEGELAQVVRSELPNLPLVQVRPLQDLLDPNLQSWRLGARLFTSFASLAFLLGAIGIYGVLSMMLDARRREFAVRMALGARTSRIAWTLIVDLLRVIGVALAISIYVGWSTRRITQPLLFATSTVDPWILSSTAGLLLVLAAIAGARPVRDVACIEPAVQLRGD